MNGIFVDLNLGLGDAILCNGLIRELAKAHDPVVLPCWTWNLPSVCHMFSDLSHVRVHPVENDSLRGLPHLTSLPIGGPVEGKTFDEAFYIRAGIPFEKRWESFFLPSSDSAVPPPINPYVLVFDTASGGRHPIPVEGLRPGKAPRIADWVPMIEAAEEVHCIDSAPLHLVESVPTKGKLFFYRNARSETSGLNVVLRKPWVVVG